MQQIGRDSPTFVLDERLEVPDEALEFYDYWLLIRPCWRRILICTLGAVFSTVLLTIFVLPHWFRAQAVLRPASQETQNQQAVMANARGIINSLGSSVSYALGIGSNDNDAQEFMIILASYDFTTSLIRKYQLQSHVVPPTFLRTLQQRLGINPYTPWKQFRKMRSLLDINYDLQGGNMTLGFRDKNREMARKILGYYIDELRVMLRKRATAVATVAVASLERESLRTSDVLLVQQIDQLVAQQLQDKLTAEMQSDFVFTVADPPSVPDGPSEPWMYLNVLAAAALTPLFCVLWIVFYQSVYKPQRARYEQGLEMQSAENGTGLLWENGQPANATAQQTRHA
jgi:hypothetical protein